MGLKILNQVAGAYNKFHKDAKDSLKKRKQSKEEPEMQEPAAGDSDEDDKPAFKGKKLK